MTKRKLPLFHFLPLPHRPRASLSLVLIFRSSGSLWAPTQEAGFFFPHFSLSLSLSPSLPLCLPQSESHVSQAGLNPLFSQGWLWTLGTPASTSGFWDSPVLVYPVLVKAWVFLCAQQTLDQLSCIPPLAHPSPSFPPASLTPESRTEPATNGSHFLPPARFFLLLCEFYFFRFTKCSFWKQAAFRDFAWILFLNPSLLFPPIVACGCHWNQDSRLSNWGWGLCTHCKRSGIEIFCGDAFRSWDLGLTRSRGWSRHKQG